MKKKAAIVILASLLFLGCQNEGTKDSSQVIKKVGTEVVTEKDYQTEIESIPAQYKSYYETEEGKLKVVDELIKQKMFYLEAKKEGLDKNQDYKDELRKAEERILAGILVKKKIMDGITLSDEELNKEYESNKETYQIEGKVSASHILIKENEKMTLEQKEKAKSKAKEALEKALAGEDFAELAKTYSEGPTGPQGGDLGEFGRGRMVPEFENAAFEGEAGKVIPNLVKTKFGYHIIKINSKTESGYKTIEEVKPEIEDKLLNEKRKDVYTKWVEELKNIYLEKVEEKKEKAVEKVEIENKEETK